MSLVTAAAFSDTLEAHLAKARIEDEGIACYISDQHIVSADWFLSGAVGGVKVQVAPGDLDAARKILGSPVAPPAAAAPEYTCPDCGSHDVQINSFARRLAFMFIVLAALPIPWRPMRCNACDHTWRPRRGSA